MSPTRPQRLQQQLAQQMGFIAASSAAYDRGEIGEAIRIGTSIRILLHDTERSRSLFTLLNAKHTPLLSTVVTIEPSKLTSKIFFEGMASFTGAGFSPKLGHGNNYVELPAEEWWNQPVIKINDKILTRKIIALTAANKDGGAHVDDQLPNEYESLVDGVWQRIDGARVANHHLLYLRQMGYEITHTPKLPVLAGDAFYNMVYQKFEAESRVQPGNHSLLMFGSALLIEQARTKTGADAQALIERSKEISLRTEGLVDGAGSYNLACAEALLGNETECLRWLEHAERRGKLPSKTHIEQDVDFQSVRNTDWFRELLDRLQ